MRRIAENVTGFLLIALSSAVFLEAISRLWFGIPLLSSDSFRDKHIHRQLVVYDPTLGWTMTPNWTGEGINTLDYGIRKNGGETEIRTGGVLAVGSSFTAGGEVFDGESWPALLEARLHIPVINAAVGSYGSDQIIMQAERLLPITRPKTVLVALSDATATIATHSISGAPKPYYTVEYGDLVLHNSPVPSIDAGSGNWLSVKRLLGYSFTIDRFAGVLAPFGWYSSGDIFAKTVMESGADGADITCRLLKRLKQKTDELHVRTLMVAQYGAGIIMTMQKPPEVALLVEQCARAMGVQIVDEFEGLKNIYESNKVEFDSYYKVTAAAYGHMSERGNRYIADLIADALARPAIEGLASGYIEDSAPLGDGRNLLPHSESLEPQVFHGSVIARIAALSNWFGNDPRRYRIEAIGPDSEHYVASGQLDLPPGPYTLSFDVRADGTTHLRAQILDDGSNGVVANFDLTTASASVIRIGSSRFINAAVKSIGGEWYRASLTGWTQSPRVHLFFGPMGNGGESTFKPDGEAVILRALQLENGRTASAYKPSGD